MLVFRQELTHDPALNLAIEERLLNTASEDVFMLWRDDPCVVVGRGQNARAQVDQAYANAHNIAVVRRLSGGGAVYHDAGNVCFTCIALDPQGRAGDHAAFTEPVIRALMRMGVPAEREGRNDISVAGKKISGSAQYTWEGRLCHHGTLLFETDVMALNAVLRPDAAKLRGKGIASVSARVGNLKEWLPDMAVDRFADALIADMLVNLEGAVPYGPDSALLRDAQALADARYRDPLWTWGEERTYDIRKAGRFPGGGVEFLLCVREGVIESAAIFGDFLAFGDVSPLADALRGAALSAPGVHAALAPVYPLHPLGGIALEELLTLF